MFCRLRPNCKHISAYGTEDSIRIAYVFPLSGLARTFFKKQMTGAPGGSLSGDRGRSKRARSSGAVAGIHRRFRSIGPSPSAADSRKNASRRGLDFWSARIDSHFLLVPSGQRKTRKVCQLLLFFGRQGFGSRMISSVALLI